MLKWDGVGWGGFGCGVGWGGRWRVGGVERCETGFEGAMRVWVWASVEAWPRAVAWVWVWTWVWIWVCVGCVCVCECVGAWCACVCVCVCVWACVVMWW